MNEYLSFSDVLILPKYSNISSRKNIDTSYNFNNLKLNTSIVSSNMDSVTSLEMCKAMKQAGGIGALHRFWSIEENVKIYKTLIKDSMNDCIVSFGLGSKELERAEALVHAGADMLLLDVAHGASLEVVNQVKNIRNILGKDLFLIVGNFATANTINDVLDALPKGSIDMFKIGIGGGAACTTRKVTGVGMPTFASIFDCKRAHVPLMADGGIRDSGDFCKAIAAGADLVMCGRMFAGCDESPAENKYERILDEDGIFIPWGEWNKLSEKDKKEWEEHRSGTLACFQKKFPLYKDIITHKKYRGSASLESYEVQGKVSDWRTPEGEAYWTPATGPVANVVQQLSAALRSSMSYVGANTLQEYQEKVEFIKVTHGGFLEGKAHGKT